MISLILFTFIFPPFYYQSMTAGVYWNVGYHFIFNPPNISYTYCTVNIGMLLTEWVVILLVGSLFWLLFFENKSASGGKEKY